jgi:type I restriction enzyme S subunit
MDKPDHSWPVYGVSNRNGVNLSHYQPGKEFNSPYKRIQKDWFFHNPTRANVGSLGRVPDVPADSLTSPEYQVWRITKELLPDFVEILIQLPLFLDLIECHRVGAVKERLFVQNLMEIPVPHFKQKQQQAIVDHWKLAHKKVTSINQAAEEREGEITRDFLAALHLSEKSKEISQRAFALRWVEIERWGVGQSRKACPSMDLSAGRYPVVRLGDVITDLQNGWSPKCYDRPAEENEWGVLKLGAVSFGNYNEEENKALPPSFTPLPALEVKEGDVLFIRGNVLRLVGACSYVANTRPHLMMPDLIFRAVFGRQSEIDPRFLAEVMRTPHLRQQIEAVATGSSPTMKKISKPGLLALRLPLPPLDIQKRLVAKITKARDQIAAERAAAAKLTKDTSYEIEQMILGYHPSR